MGQSRPTPYAFIQELRDTQKSVNYACMITCILLHFTLKYSVAPYCKAVLVLRLVFDYCEFITFLA